MRPGSRTEQGQHSREAILDAAVAEFTLSGFRGASLNSISRRAGITKSGLLHHFESKDALLASVLEERTALQRAQHRDIAIPEGEQHFFDQLRLTVEVNQRDRWWPRFFTIMVAESFTEGHPALPVLQRRYRNAAEVASQLLREHYPVLEEVSARRLAAVCYAVLDGLQIQLLLDDSFSMPEAFDEFMTRIIASLSTDEAPHESV